LKFQHLIKFKFLGTKFGWQFGCGVKTYELAILLKQFKNISQKWTYKLLKTTAE